jgi:hypothetical protein
MTARTAYSLAVLLLLLVGTAAYASRHESRQDFIIRSEVGGFTFDGPNLANPRIDVPEVDGPDINGPEVDPPPLDWLDVLYTVGLIVVLLAGIAALVLIARRFGPNSSTDDHAERTSSLESGHTTHPIPTGDGGWAAFERFCYELLRDGDPSRAIRVAMRYAESGMGRLPARLADETTNEWLRRVESVHNDLAAPLRRMATSYRGIRFGGSDATPAERDDSVEALRVLARAACGTTPPDAPSELSTGGRR